MNESQLWSQVEIFFEKTFDTGPNPSLETMLFLIGLQEYGSGQRKFSKDEKLQLLHIAVCRLLEPFGFYKFSHHDAEGWPHYDEIQPLPALRPNEQSLLMKKAIVQYFLEEELI